jgi:hypothetical protein
MRINWLSVITAVQNSSEVKFMFVSYGHFGRRCPGFKVQAPIVFRAQPVRPLPDTRTRPAICADTVVRE